MSTSREPRYGVFDIGFRIDDDLTVVEHLGGSRKVDIYLCRSSKEKGVVACKVLNARYTIDYSSLEAVMAEGQILCQLDHPNVIQGYDVELLPYPRIVMEYLRGQTLSTTFFQGNWDAFGMTDFVDVAAQLADALDYTHSKGYVHLDVKPSNVMYYDGHATLFDFSVAEEYTPGDRLRDNAGTVEYMAPEQTYRRQIGHATDVFGIGAVFYRLLTGGELPYPVVRRDDPNEDRGYKRELDYTDAPKPPSSINPAVPPEVDAIALRAVDVDYDARYPTPAALGDALAEVSEDES